MPPKKKSRGRRSSSGKPGDGRRLKVLLASLFLLTFLLVSLVLLSQMRQSLRPVPPSVSPSPPAASPSKTASPAPRAASQGISDDIRVEVDSALLRSGISLEQLKVSRSGNALRYDVQGETPSGAIIDELSGRLVRIASDIRLEALPALGEIRIYREETAVCLLQFRPPAAVRRAKSGARMAIIMDDLGGDLNTARALLAIDLPVTIAILPGAPNAPKVANLANREGREVLIHIPMEPQGYPATDPGEDALLVAQSPEEIRRRFQGYLERVPHAVGTNNHMGSRFTENGEGMEVVLSEMKEAGLFFVDSRTTGRSVAFAEARRAGVPAASRDIFLDNVQDVERISREIRKLVALAERQGQAVGICHPHAQTLEALRREAPYLKGQNVEIVPVSQLLTR